jgi:hypothetical protein
MSNHRKHPAAVAALALALAASACGSDRDGAPISGPNFSAARGHRVFIQRERLGNPLVSEVMIRKARHHEHNTGTPSTDAARFTDDLTEFVTGVAGRSPAVAGVLTSVLLPDMLLVYPERAPGTAGWLSWALAGGYGGRKLADDVVDAGLMAIFGPLLDPNNVSPGLTTDNVAANDKPFGTTFPYLASATLP